VCISWTNKGLLLSTCTVQLRRLFLTLSHQALTIFICLFSTELYRIRHSELTASATLITQCGQLLAVQVLTKRLRVFSDISVILSQCVSPLWSYEEGWHRYMMVCVAWRIKSIIMLASGIIHERSVNNSRKWHHQRSAFCSFYIHTPTK